jgi:uncharacterized protein YdeI (YjbR/CyaY-like superfamily)
MARIADIPDPASPNGKDVRTPPSRASWRAWLVANRDRDEGIWVVYRKKSSQLEGPTYDDLLDEALCFGWIDSQVRRVDDDRMMQWFSPRRRGGLWSARNRERIERLVRDGLMTDTGMAVIDAARADGSWTQTDEVDALVIPGDLGSAFEAEPTAAAAFGELPDSVKKRYLWWIHEAKRPETRGNRIEETVRRVIEDGAAQAP